MSPPPDDSPSNPLHQIERRLAAYRDLADTGEDVAARIAALEDQLRSAEYHASVTGSAGAQVIAGSNNIQVYINEHVSAAQREVVRRWFNEYLRGVWSEHSSLALVGSRAGVDRERIPLAAVYTALDVTAEHNIQWADSGHRAGALEGLLHDYMLQQDDPLLPGVHVESLAERGIYVITSPLFHHDKDYGNALSRQLVAEFDRLHPVVRSGHVQDRGVEQIRWARRATALEAAAWTSRHVIIGAPGGGKSTFARYLALCMAGEFLGRSEAALARLNALESGGAEHSESVAADWHAWPHGALLPVFVELRRFVADTNTFPKRRADATADRLLRYVEMRERPGIAPEFAPHFRGYLQDGRALLILDGLDEVPEAGRRRELIKAIIADFAEGYPTCRMLVTSRPYAYEPNSPWRLDDLGFTAATLADFDDVQIARFIHAWHQSAAARDRLPRQRAERCADALATRLSTDRQLQPLASRPLLLTMIADLNATGGSLPSSRAALYEESIKLLVDRWNEAREVQLADDRPMIDWLDMTLDDVRTALERLAYDAHREQGEHAPDAAADISRADLLTALADARGKDKQALTSEQRILHYLQQRSGILVCEDENTYRFPHRSFQEFMAACRLNKTSFPQLVSKEVRERPALWREVVQFVFGLQDRPSDVIMLLRKLLPKSPDAHTEASDPRLAVAYYAALGLKDSCLAAALRRGEELDEDDAKAIDRLRWWLTGIVYDGALPPSERADAGRLLAELGDDRAGVNVNANGLPNIAWVAIPAGAFTMGSADDDPEAWDGEKPQLTVNLASFCIAKYPVTVAQYRPFVDGDGYQKAAYWTREGWAWRRSRTRRRPDYWDDPRFGDDNQPVVGVTWYEAAAYCSWLTERRPEAIRLPTEAEWECAARGRDGRRYPWGETFDTERCNSNESGIGRPSAAGMYPLPEGYWTAQHDVGDDPLDMSGNVFEWTSSTWRDRKDKPIEAATEATASRVVRGGSYYYDPFKVRCPARASYDPAGSWNDCGFRLAADVH